MTNINNILIERNKELLAKIEELEKIKKTEISREAQLKIIDKIEKWKKENYETGDRLKKYEENTYPAFIEQNRSNGKGVWKSLAGHVNFELLMVQYLHTKENPLDELIEMMLDRIIRNVVRSYNWEGQRDKELEENKKLKKEWKEKVEKVMEEKEIEKSELKEEIKDLEVELEETKEGREANLDAIKVGIEFEVGKLLPEIEKLKEELNSKGETLLQFIDMLAREKVQNEKLQTTITEREENLKEINEKLARVTQKNEELEKQLCKKRKGFGKLGLKTKVKVRQLVEKAKFQVQELVARIEVKTK